MPHIQVPLNQDRQFLVDVIIKNIQSNNQIALSDTEVFNMQHKGLIDTGADTSCITQEMASDLGVTPSGYRVMQTAGDPKRCPVYRVALGICARTVSFDSKKKQIIPQHADLFFHVGSFVAIPQQENHRGFDCIVGMDMLKHCVLNYSYDLLTIGWLKNPTVNPPSS